MKLVRERLYEESGSYTEDQLKKDFETYITVENVKISEEDKLAFFNDVITAEFRNGMINSINELFDVISTKINSFLG